MRLSIEVDLGNEAMQSPKAVVDSLTASFARSTFPIFGPLPAGSSGTLVDGNGNTVGRWEVES